MPEFASAAPARATVDEQRPGRRDAEAGGPAGDAVGLAAVPERRRLA